MMKIYACSDLHISPDVPVDIARPFLEEAAEQADHTLFCGDIFEGSWHPLGESVAHQNGQEMWALIKAQTNPILIRGNHDWTLKRYAPDEDIEIHTYHVLKVDGVNWYVTHGWAEYDVVFGRLARHYHYILPLLSLFAPIYTKLRTPLTLERKQKTRKYWERVRTMATHAILHSIDLNRELGPDQIVTPWVPVWGHTHHRHLDKYEHWMSINCGDFIEAGDGGIVIEDGVPEAWEQS
jgi:UDP-2,3-diacylglucosamine pyrophosphatase LpxH